MNLSTFVLNVKVEPTFILDYWKGKNRKVVIKDKVKVIVKETKVIRVIIKGNFLKEVPEKTLEVGI